MAPATSTPVGPGADDRKSQPSAPLNGVLDPLCDLECIEDFVTDGKLQIAANLPAYVLSPVY